MLYLKRQIQKFACMAYIAHGIIKCTLFLSVGHRDNTLFYGTISCLLIFLLNTVRLRLVLLYFAMFQCFCAFFKSFMFVCDHVLSIDYIKELMKVCAVSSMRPINR